MKVANNYMQRFIQSYNITFHNLLGLVLVPLTLFLVFQAISNLLKILIDNAYEMNAILGMITGMTSYLVAIVLSLILNAYIIKALASAIDKKTTIKKALNAGTASIWQLFVTQLLKVIYVLLYPTIIALAIMLLDKITTNTSNLIMGIATTIALIGALVAIYIIIDRLPRSAFATFIALNENKKPMDALLKSRKLVQGRWLEVTGNFVLIGVIYTAIVTLISFPMLNLQLNNVGIAFYAAILVLIISYLSMTTMAYAYLLYKSYK